MGFQWKVMVPPDSLSQDLSNEYLCYRVSIDTDHSSLSQDLSNEYLLWGFYSLELYHGLRPNKGTPYKGLETSFRLQVLMESDDTRKVNKIYPLHLQTLKI